MMLMGPVQLKRCPILRNETNHCSKRTHKINIDLLVCFNIFVYLKAMSSEFVLLYEEWPKTQLFCVLVVGEGWT